MIEGQLSLFELYPQKAESVQTQEQEILFTECRDCWCRDCRHNALREGVPRDFCGKMLPCPSCDMCKKEGQPEICVIGAIKEGCGVRAAEEGIVEE